MADRTGIYPHGAGWRAVVSQGRARPLIQRHFAKDNGFEAMQEWRADTKAKLRLTRKQRATLGTFEGDAKRYLKAVASLTTLSDRTREIGLWIALFGTTPRESITAVDIRTQRDAWALSPRSETDKRPVSHATINKRLRALSNLWTVLDGSRAPNPVRDVPEFREHDLPARVVDYQTIRRLLDAMPETLTKARVRVLAYTGWPFATLRALTVDDLDLEAGLARLPRRQKGAGAAGAVVPLLPEAVSAMKALLALDGLSKDAAGFSRSSLRKSFKRAAKKAKAPWLRPYDLRHLYAATLAAASKDERAVQAVLQHADLRTTRRYTLGSVPVRVASAVAALAKQIGKSGRVDTPYSGAKRRAGKTRRPPTRKAKRRETGP